MSARDKLVIEEIEQSELTRDQPMPEGSVGVRKNRAASTMYSLRLPQETVAELEALAGQLDVPTSALVRGFVLDGLAAQKRTTVNALVDKLQMDVRQLKRMIS
ncbi:MAG: hypothetical protein QOK10_3644 [Pseudonocardiales bacterium]|jgi:hypothetical protein|nr:hypothetical protein [Pseudonocardiales bacterium]